jgi:protease-4
MGFEKGAGMNTIATNVEPEGIKGRSANWRALASILFWIVLPLTLGAVLAITLIPRPAVGLIRINSEVWSLSADFVLAQIREAHSDNRIKAVVVVIDSPGGEVVPTQSIFLELKNLQAEMPVVGSIESFAASGGYLAALATDPIYAKPSSTVGNVGVWGYFPVSLAVNDVILASGPFKLTASNSEEFLREIEGVKQEFLATVAAQRGERLQIQTAELAQGLAYSGRQAQSLGMIDSLGSQSEAIAKAAELAGIRDYELVDLEARVIEKLYEGLNPLYLQPWEGRPVVEGEQRSLPPGIYLLYDARIGGTR